MIKNEIIKTKPNSKKYSLQFIVHGNYLCFTQTYENTEEIINSIKKLTNMTSVLQTSGQNQQHLLYTSQIHITESGM